MPTWYEEEDRKYSVLYESGYPIGNPMAVVQAFDYSPELKVCDLGCGRASLSNYFARYVGVDVSKYIIEKNQQQRSGTYHHASLHDLTCLDGESFDLVVCSDVMEHIPPDRISTVLHAISQLIANRFALAISTRKSVFLDDRGDGLHLTVWDHDKWCEAIRERFSIVRRIDKADLLLVELTNE